MSDVVHGPAAATMDPLEEAFGIPIGRAAHLQPLVTTGISARQALSDALTEALSHPPCLIAFSGGRDSSILLAAAVELARSTGLPAPIPITAWFPKAAETDERAGRNK